MKDKRRKRFDPDAKDNIMGEDVDDEVEKEKQRKLEILRVKESKLKRNISKELYLF